MIRRILRGKCVRCNGSGQELNLFGKSVTCTVCYGSGNA
jgi:DnaJ-class molecular chaperone